MIGQSAAAPARKREAVREWLLHEEARGARRGRADVIRPWVLRIAVGFAIGIGWEIYVRTSGTFATPPLAEIGKALIQLPIEPDFWSALGTTLTALFIGYALSVGIGVPFGILMGRIRSVQRVGNVYLTIMLSIPISSVVPIVVILFGIGLQARVAVVILFALPMMIANISTGVANVDRSLLEMASSFGSRGLRLVRRVIIPAAAPEIFAGLRIGAGRAVIGMIVAELIVISVGIGLLIERYTSRFEMGFAYAVIIAILLVSALFVQLVRLLERRALKWRVG